MADLNIPNLKKNPNKYIFKKRFNLKRKSKSRLFIEAFILFIFSIFLFYINYLIPNKYLLLQSLPNTLSKSFILLIELFSSLFNVALIIYIFISSILALFLLVGSIYRTYKIMKRRTKVINYK